MKVIKSTKSKYLKLLRYMGSKHKYLDVILPLIDTSKKLVEPFCGSAAVSLNVNNEEILCNDNNQYIIDIFNGFKEVTYDYYLEFLDKEPKFIQRDKENFYTWRNYYNSKYNALSIKDKSLYQIILINSCLNSMARWGPRGFNAAFGNRNFITLDEGSYKNLHNKIKNINFTCKDYVDIIASNDSSETIFFLDPPYVILPGSYQTNFNEESIHNFMDIIKNIDGQVIYTDTINKYNKELMTNPKFKYKLLGGMTSASPRKTSTDNVEIMFYSSELEMRKYESN